MDGINRQWILTRRPTGGVVTREHLQYREVPPPSATLQPGEILVRNLVFLCAPTIRIWMNPAGNYHPSIPLGTPVIGPTAARILESTNPDFPVGRCVFTLTGWQDYAVVDPRESFAAVSLYPEGVPLTDCLGVYGINTLAAYFGLLKVGEPKAGETLVVSGAAGSTGSMAAQIGRIKGCRVIGIAGGREKCRWVREACGLDVVIDYKAEVVSDRLRELCPMGIDIFFDNVGGDMLQAAVDNIAIGGRIVLCGQIANYNGDEQVPGPRDMMRIIYGRVKMQGFLASDWAHEADVAIADVMRWVAEGKIAHREDIRVGFDSLPGAFFDLFTGANHGTLLVTVGDPAVVG